jgi:phosphoenolpyruvate---glycerone phosphotransferase subunit DhaM
MSTSLLIVSHSKMLAEGVKELIVQMAGNVEVNACGGMPDGVLGTDSVMIMEAMTDLANRFDHVLVFMDLGSGVMSSQMAYDLLAEELQPKVVLVDASLVEGAFTAAVLAGAGLELNEILDQARAAGQTPKLYQ